MSYFSFNLISSFNQSEKKRAGWLTVVRVFFHFSIFSCILTFQINDEVKKVDGILGSFLSALKKDGLEESVHVVVVSDHGGKKWSNSNFHIFLYFKVFF